MPHCSRCKGRGTKCTYPIAKTSCFLLCGTLGNDTFPVDHDIFPSRTAQPLSYPPGFQSKVVDHSRLSLDLDLSDLPGDLVDKRPYSSWFTSPETWKIDRFLQIDYNSFAAMGVKRLMITINRWLTEWVEKGSNPFIHPRLYRNRFPRCVQDAYTALSCYLHRTASNEQTVFRIIEDRVEQLVAEHSILSEDFFSGKVDSRSVTFDSLEHLARVQALLVYQALCLYDGDIRLRHVAEKQIPVLNSWMEQMVEHASHAICLGGSVISSAHEQTTVNSTLSGIAHCENLLWYSWILAESIRRTWLVASGIQGGYLVIKQCRAIPCQGGMMFTTRQGVWEAQSAWAWEKLCSEVNVGLMQAAETDNLFEEVAPEDVDDFTVLILRASFGEERMERWGIQIQV